jgi:hypothetical protein
MKSHRGKLILGLVISFLILGECQSLGQEVKVPQEAQFPFLLKILTYDRALRENARDTLNLGLLYNPEDDSSVEDKDRVLEAFEEYRDKKVSGFSLEILPFDYSTFQDLPELLPGKRIHVLIITTGNGDLDHEIIGLTRERKILSFSTSPELVERGVSVGIDLVEDRMKIVINYEATKMEGSNFSARLLKICRIVRK